MPRPAASCQTGPTNREGEPTAPRAADWERLLASLPGSSDTFEATARATHALVRRRAVRSGALLLRLVLLYAQWDWSLRQVAAWAAASGWAGLSDVALLRRLQGARVWLGALVTASLLTERALPSPAPVRLRLVDATTLSRPGSPGIDWRLHLSFDLGAWAIDGVELTDVHGGETLVRHAVRADDILVEDRGYAHRRGVGHVLSQGGAVVLRINATNLPLQTVDGTPLDLTGWLATLPGEGSAASTVSECPVQVDTPQGVYPLRLLATRLSPAAAEAARRRLRRAARKRGHTPDQRSLCAAGCLVLVSNLDPARWPTRVVLGLYRLRWQVELVFKRLKGLLQLDHLRARGVELAQVYLLGKLLGALLVERLTHAAPGPAQAWFLQVERPLSAWRWTAGLHEAVRQAVRGHLPLATFLAALPQLERYLCDPPRRRRSQGALARCWLRTLDFTCQIP
jgi:hypothetical protein